jgi:hypothetical protein
VDYFAEMDHRMSVLQPFFQTSTLGTFDVKCLVNGGGLSGEKAVKASPASLLIDYQFGRSSLDLRPKPNCQMCLLGPLRTDFAYSRNRKLLPASRADHSENTGFGQGLAQKVMRVVHVLGSKPFGSHFV